MKGGKRALSPWNIFVKKVYREGKSKDSKYEFKHALKDASRRKGEMGTQKMGEKMGTQKVRKSRARRTRIRR